MITLRLSRKSNRFIAMTLALLMLTNAFGPVQAWALTGGPSQPEVQSFEPIGTSDMVDLFSGDFNYNIPLLQIDDYPVNLAYHSGISMDQEASWVGLGWNVNVGEINRNMRGIPDDFDGDIISKELNMKPDKTFGLNGGFGGELFGSEKLGGSLSFSIGMNYNNYRGVGIEKSVNISLSASKKGLGKSNANLGLSSSSDNGLDIQPSVGLSTNVSQADNRTTSIGLNIGTAFNSRAGLRQLTISTSINTAYEYTSTHTNKDKSTRTDNVSNSNSLFGTSSSFSFGGYTYTPSINMPMDNFSVSANFKVGGELFGWDGNYTMSGYFSSQRLQTNQIDNPAYGYMHYDEGQSYDDALLDFNRENDRAYSQHLPALPLSSLTFDLYSVNGQGVGGSYRPFRSDIGYIYDASSSSTSDGFSIGGEFGVGNLAHVGGDVTVNNTYSRSGRWTDGNNAAGKLLYHGTAAYGEYEPFYFKEANEKSVDSDAGFYQAYGSDQPQRFELVEVSKFNTQTGTRLVNKHGGMITMPTANNRNKRDKRNQVIYQLTHKEVNDGMGLDALPSSYAAAAPNHHISEVTTYGTNGMRYVYGLPAYNIIQKEVTFAEGKTRGGDGGNTGNCTTGFVTYDAGDNGMENPNGLDNYYSSTTTPAFAYSYLLTAVLSPDYVDADNVQGPSNGDLGYYTKFSYKKIDSTYRWRTPVGDHVASHNEGLKSDDTDDKANYVYGEKEIWYIDSIVTKNYVAFFVTEPRKDGFGVKNENGELDTDAGGAMRLLRKITLYSLKDYVANGVSAIPIKEVHFEYDYSLCPNVLNNSGVSEGSPNINANAGKLTLKKVYFTYQNSNKARLSPYVFNYSSQNPSYNAKGYDRWGNYKPNPGGCLPLDPTVPAAEFPYVEQDTTVTNPYARSWNLDDITLPSGGKILVNYESDDYAYVQNKQAMQMCRIIGAVDNGATPLSGDLETAPASVNISDDDMTSHRNRWLLVELPLGTYTIDDFIGGVDRLYFRCLMQFHPTDVKKYDYVSGYCEIDRANSEIVSGLFTAGGNPVMKLVLKEVKLKDSSSDTFNPITKAAIQFGRMNLSNIIWDQPAVTGDESFGKDILVALVNSSFVKNIGDAIKGPNMAIYDKDKGKNLVTHKSFIRLNNPSHKKLGGGCRVTSIRLSDEFYELTNHAMSSYAYGQEYEYKLADGSSSGVASYEPQLGGDENPWKQPISFSTENLLAPDEEHYIETPLGESFFPSAGVGYSRVTVKNLQRTSVTRNATGKVVHEFYTAKDYPTIVDRTDIVHDQDKTDPFSITSILYTYSRDHLTATQGFSVELNDMHGKQKKQSVYAEEQIDPITEVEYRYKSSVAPGPGIDGHLDNNATVIDKQGNVSTKQIGVFYDMAADMRQFHSEVSSIALQINLDAFVFPPLPAPLAIPMLWPSLSFEETQFRSATTTKLIQRFAILDEVIARDLGSVVRTQNLAYDAETGELLLSSATTDFNDTVYSLTYPAHWYYDGMGQAYRNIGLYYSSLNLAAVTNAKQYFVKGDELVVDNTIKGWVTAVNNNSITVVKKDGTAITGSHSIKVLRSGRRNLSATPIASVTTLANPLDRFRQNIFSNVLQASSAEFSDQWRTFCDCFDEPGSPASPTTNPYVLGILGNWRMKRSWLHLTQRTQTNYDNNTNVRRDGVFTSYTPFYKLQNNSWAIDERDWTYTANVTEFSPFGQELENQDALGRFSAATFGYVQTLPTGVAANSRYRDIGTDNFEDYGFSPCADNHFKFLDNTVNVTNNESHTGRYSIRVASGTPVVMEKQLAVCDPAACELAINTSLSGGMTPVMSILVDNGTAPYQIEWNVLQGSPAIDFNGTTIEVPGSGWKIEVIVTDGAGCKTSSIVSY
jgi:hypothetical protein